MLLKHWHCWHIPLAILLVAAVGRPLRAVTPAILVDDELRQRTVRVQRIEDDELSFFDEQRKLVIEPIEHYVQLLVGAESLEEPSPSTAASDGVVVVTATNGRRIVGAWRGATLNGEALRMANRWVGQVTMPLEQIRWVDLQSHVPHDALPPPTSGAGDWAVLTNGDVLEGFVVSVRDDHFEFQLSGSAQTVALARTNVARLRLANAASATIRRGTRVGFEDGSLLDFATVSIVSDRLVAQPRDGVPNGVSSDIVVPMAHVRRIVFDTVGVHLVPLRDLPYRVDSGGTVFGLAHPPVITSGGSMRLHAPIMIVFELPPGAVRFAASARIEEAGAVSAWADMNLRIGSPEAAAKTYRLGRRKRAMLVNVKLAGRTMTLDVAAAVNGPVMDRLRLVNGTLLIHRD